MTISSIASSPVAATSDGTRTLVQTTPATTGAETAKPAATGANVIAQSPSPERVAQAVKQINDDFVQKGQNLYASIERDKATGINVIKFQDSITKELISQYPSKAIIAMAEALGQSNAAKGQLLNVSA